MTQMQILDLVVSLFHEKAPKTQASKAGSGIRHQREVQDRGVTRDRGTGTKAQALDRDRDANQNEFLGI